jgi:hypothetical protein
MSTVGYRRVSTTDQNFDRQDLGPVDKLFEEKLSGKTAKDRPALNMMIDWVREGDTTRRKGGHNAEVDFWLEEFGLPGFAVRAAQYSPRTFFVLNPD